MQGQYKNGQVILYHLHMHPDSPLIPISNLPCIVRQPPPSSLCCPRPSSCHTSNLTLVYPTVTSIINTLLAIRYSSILSTCPNNHNNLWSALFANSLSILYCSLPPHSQLYTITTLLSKFLKHFISRTFTSLRSCYTPFLCSEQWCYHNYSFI